MSCNSHQYLELYHAGLLGAGVINPLNLRLAGAELPAAREVRVNGEEVELTVPADKKGFFNKLFGRRAA